MPIPNEYDSGIIEPRRGLLWSAARFVMRDLGLMPEWDPFAPIYPTKAGIDRAAQRIYVDQFGDRPGDEEQDLEVCYRAVFGVIKDLQDANPIRRGRLFWILGILAALALIVLGYGSGIVRLALGAAICTAGAAACDARPRMHDDLGLMEP